MGGWLLSSVPPCNAVKDRASRAKAPHLISSFGISPLISQGAYSDCRVVVRVERLRMLMVSRGRHGWRILAVGQVFCRQGDRRGGRGGNGKQSPIRAVFPHKRREGREREREREEEGGRAWA